MSKKRIFLILSVVFLLLTTFGVAIYGIMNEKEVNIEYNGNTYKWESPNTYVNKNDHHIYVEEELVDNEYVITLKIEEDDVLLEFYNNFQFKIEKGENELVGSEDDLLFTVDHELQEYIDLLKSYRDYVSFMDEFPGMIIFPFFAIPPFAFGLILILDIFRKRVNKTTVMNYIFRGIAGVAYILSLGLLVFIVHINT